jgi:hypothetical protein
VTESLRVPVAGDYKVSLKDDKAQVLAPNGTIWIFDFEKKQVSTLDAYRVGYFPLHLNDFLDFGDRLPDGFANRFEANSNLSFSSVSGQEGRLILGLPTTPYNLDMESIITREPEPHGGLGNGGGLRRRFEYAGNSQSTDKAMSLALDQFATFQGSPGRNSATPESAGVKIGGEVWMGTASIPEDEVQQLNIAAVGTLFRGSPALRSLTDRMKKTKLTFLGADYSISILDQNGQLPAKSPVVSIKIVSIESSPVDVSAFYISSRYGKITPPSFVLGTNR